MMKSEIRDFVIFSSGTNYGAIIVASQVLSLPLLRKNLYRAVPDVRRPISANLQGFYFTWKFVNLFKLTIDGDIN